MEELKTNLKYAKDYSRTPEKVLKSLINKMMPAICPDYKEPESKKKSSNLMNKSLPFLKNDKSKE